MGTRVRVATFNIQHGLRGDGARVDIDLTGSVAAGLKADVLALQEVDVGVPRSARVDEAAEVAAACGLEHAFGAATSVGVIGLYGNALAAKSPLRDVEVKRLPRRRFRSEPRAAVLARIDLAGTAVTVAATHLSIHPEEVHDQLKAAVAWLLARPGPWILVGDLNLLPHHVAPVVEAHGFELAGGDATFPAHAPRIRIDHVAVAGGLRIAGVEIGETPASDHRPLVVEVDIPDELP